MTIDELIERLAAYPGDYEVVMYIPEDTGGNVFDEVQEVREGHYDDSTYEQFKFNGNGKYVDVNAVAIVGRN